MRQPRRVPAGEARGVPAQPLGRTPVTRPLCAAFTGGGQRGAGVSGQKGMEVFGFPSAAHAAAFAVSVPSGTRIA